MSVSLEPFSRSDFDRLMAWVDSPDLHENWCGQFFRYPLCRDQLEQYVQEAEQSPPQRHIFRVVDGDTHDIAGQTVGDTVGNTVGDTVGDMAGATADESIPGLAVVGHIELSHIWPGLSGRVSRVLVAPHQQGRGLGVTIVTRLADFSFQTYDLHRLDLSTPVYNQSAIRCYEKVGFQKVGVWPQGGQTRSGPVDLQWMSLFRNHWRQG